jgi:hypothetical protein
MPTDCADCFVVDFAAPRDPGEKAVFLRGTDGRVSGLQVFSATLDRLAPVGDAAAGARL